MIVSASRRTDIPAFYMEWFCKRLEEGFVLVRNPMNQRQVSKIRLSASAVDGIVFWSKNPKPLLDKVDAIKDYAYYMQFSLNPYESDIEQHLPPRKQRIQTFQKLSDKIGKERVIWRYDPILLSKRYSIEWHVEEFSKMADQLAPFTEKCVFSYLDFYRSMKKSMQEKHIRELRHEEKLAIAEGFSKIAKEHSIVLETCAEEISLEKYGIFHGRCIDDRIFTKMDNCPVVVDKDKNQRQVCGCVSSIDIGFYNTCQNGCVYCYANHSEKKREKLCHLYDKNAPLLCSVLTEQDRVTERKVQSNKEIQMRLLF